MLFLSTGTGSPIIARQTAPFFLFILILLLIAAFLFVLYLLVTKRLNFLKSDKYKQKEMNRLTKYKDVVRYCHDRNLSSNDTKILWQICQITKCTNVLYLLKSNSAVNELFRNAYNLMKAQNLFTDQKLNDFFVCQYNIEVAVAQIKKIPSTKQIPVASMIFYISETGEQYPFCVISNTKDFISLEVPEFIYQSERKPKTLVRLRFNYKTKDGLSYNFVSRIIRYNESNDNQFLMILAHTDKLSCQAQRHYKREFFEEKCLFSPIRINKNRIKNDDMFIYSNQKFEGKLTNISAGGCCINTNLPIRENQHIGVQLPEHNIDETIVGIIKRTRKLPNGTFALHIQFIHISIKTRNQIYTLVYKYEV